MSTLIARLPQVLNQHVTLDVESTGALCREIEDSSTFTTNPGGAPAPKPPAPIPDASSVSLRPIDFLQTIGLAMLPPRHVQENLASWHWTLIRYGYLIEAAHAGPTPLATNSLAGDYKHHHMTALSEAIGVGCALTYAKSWLGNQVGGTAQIHAPIDFDYLIGDNARPAPGAPGATNTLAPGPVAVRGSTRKPDYLITAEQPNGLMRLMIVECKGNSGGRSRAIGQLGSAMHQLAAIDFHTPGTTPTAVDRHAYATYISKTGGSVRVFGVDPPEEGKSWVEPTSARRSDVQHLERESDGSLRLPSLEDVAGRALLRISERSIAWAGADESTDAALRTTIESDAGDLTGTRSTLALPGGQKIRVFTGALKSVVRNAREVVRDGTSRHGYDRPNRQTSSALPNRWSPTRRDDDTERIASALSDDGLALEIEVDPN